MTMAYWKDKGFRELVQLCPALKCMEKYIPANKNIPELSNLEGLYSSYKDNDYHHFFYSLIKALKPDVCVELGVLEGFSLFSMGYALKDNRRGKITGFDLFENYPYRHCVYKNIIGHISDFGLQDYVEIHKADAFNTCRDNKKVDLLHVDLSNTGDTYRKIFNKWSDIVNTVIVLEGGSVERDQIEWMINNNKPSIVDAIKEIKDYYIAWNIITINAFPSLTVAFKKEI